jgi:hypothetical protein
MKLWGYVEKQGKKVFTTTQPRHLKTLSICELKLDIPLPIQSWKNLFHLS